MLRNMAHLAFLPKAFYRRSEIEKWLIISSAFSVFLVIIRIILTGKLHFIFLPWNLFLAFVPFAISNWLESRRFIDDRSFKLLGLVLVWILFIPNSFYILTDLFHLEDLEHSSKWFDLTVIFSFAWNGLLFGILSVRQMERIFARNFSSASNLWFLLPVMWLNALGIFIGRYMRFNSWDVLTNPFELLGDMSELLFRPFDHIYAWSMITCFATFMIILYTTIKKLVQAF
jgi:uncharacterized membrane protein